MNKTALAFVFGALFAALHPAVHAQEKKEVYVTPNVNRKSLVNEPLAGVQDRQLTIDEYVLPAGWVGGKHYHVGPVHVYVLDGLFLMDEQGKPRRTFKPGDVYVEPVGIPMQASNPSTSAPTRILVIQVTPKGEPLMYKAQ